MIENTTRKALFAVVVVSLAVSMMGVAGASEWGETGTEDLEVYEGTVSEDDVMLNMTVDVENASEEVIVVADYQFPDSLETTTIGNVTLQDSGNVSGDASYFELDITGSDEDNVVGVSLSNFTDFDTDPNTDGNSSLPTSIDTSVDGTTTFGGIYEENLTAEGVSTIQNDSDITDVGNVSGENTSSTVSYTTVGEAYEVDSSFSGGLDEITVDGEDVTIPESGSEYTFSANATVKDGRSVSGASLWVTVSRDVGTVDEINESNLAYQGTVPAYGNAYTTHEFTVNSTGTEAEVNVTVEYSNVTNTTVEDGIWAEVDYDESGVIGNGVTEGTQYDVEIDEVDGVGGGGATATIIPTPSFFTDTFGSTFGTGLFYFLLAGILIDLVALVVLMNRRGDIVTSGGKAAAYSGIVGGGSALVFGISGTTISVALLAIFAVLTLVNIYLYSTLEEEVMSEASIETH